MKAADIVVGGSYVTRRSAVSSTSVIQVVSKAKGTYQTSHSLGLRAWSTTHEATLITDQHGRTWLPRQISHPHGGTQ